MEWTEENIDSLSPDDATAKRGKSLAHPSKWVSMSTNEEAIWGECKGSGSQPYIVQINLNGPKFKCSCPVPRPPCKHVLGLFYSYVQNKNNFKKQTPPEAVANWLSKHQQTAKIVENKSQENGTALSDTASEKSKNDKEKRWQERVELMSNGIEELELWLTDMVRQGIANTDAFKPSFWNQIAAKMVDAKLPRISTYLKETHQLIIQKQDWTELITARLGELYLWVEAFKKRESLAPLLQEELYVALGKTITKPEVLGKNPSIKDLWLVLGKKEGVDVEGRNYRRVWLQGQNYKKIALILDFAFGNAGYEQQYMVGDLLQGDLTYYSNHYPQRAILENLKSTVAPANIGAYTCIHDFLKAYSQAIAQNPWLVQFPIILSDIIPFLNERNELIFTDIHQKIIVSNTISQANLWKILAVSGGQPITIFGEWDGMGFEPLSMVTDGGIFKITDN